MHGLLKCNINASVHVRATNVSLRDVTIVQMGNGASKCEWYHALEAHGGFWEFWRKLVELRRDTRQEGLTFACLRRPWAGVARDGGSRWKSQNRKNVYLSPYVEEPLNSKVIKGFVPELRSCKCFSCFEIPMFYVYIYMNIPCTSRIYIYMVMVYDVKLRLLYSNTWNHLTVCK